GAFPVVRSLLVADLNLCYRYMTADSYDWISNGLFWAGRPILPSLRPPGLPLVIAALSKVGLLALLPVVGFLFLGLSTALLYLLLRERHDAWIAAVAAWFFFANDYVLDLAKYVLAETYAAPLLVLAVLAFVRAGRDLRWYPVVGAALGVAFLFSYAAFPAGVGLALAVLVVRKEDVRRRELWMGALLAAGAVGSWLAVRAWFHRTHPDAPRHAFELLVSPTLSNVTFYAISGVALLGLLPLSLYVLGISRVLGGGPDSRRYRAAWLVTSSAILVFLVFFYDWADKRFLVYALPFLTCALAEGLETLRSYAARGRLATVAAAALLGACLLWNQIRYPSYGFYFLALTPEHFLEAALTTRSNFKVEQHLSGARVVRLHDTLASSFSGGLFDPRPRPAPCAPSDPAIACLATLKRTADTLLKPGQPVGLLPPKDWPADPHSSFIRLRNAFERPVLDIHSADVSLGGVEAVPGADLSKPPFVAHCGPYVMARTR
ncbi:MAG: glycosyltransferase family 39 protein, partial [Acidobacteriota bacterium]